MKLNSIKYILLLVGFLLTSSFGLGQDRAFRIYNSKGKKVSYERMMKKLAKQDVVLFGELHNNPIAHWLQFEVTAELMQKRELILGAEMFEADNQDELDLYLHDSITAKGLDTLARLWPNYDTDYAPLVNLAKDSQLQFVATNIPRRFANSVYRNGFAALDSLNTMQKAWVAPLPLAFDSLLPRYQNILSMMGDHGSPNLVKAQASKDATMAHFILKHAKEGGLFIHYNGAYHSDFYEGILWYLHVQAPDKRYTTISTVSQADLCKLESENKGKADFIIVVDEDMTTTY